MAQPPAAMQTSWLRVQGPADARTCPWCRNWVGRVLPIEMKGTYASEHRADHACRCRLEPEQLRPDPEEPDCTWA